MLKAVIMAGGKGERFWPYSRDDNPKQCLRIISKKTMVEDTIDRLKPIIEKKDIHIIANKELSEKIKEYAPNVNYVIEPMRRNTAAAIGLAAINLDEDDIMFVETTDHVYKDNKDYLNHVKKAAEIAEKGRIVLIGIKPTHPHTGLGYIEKGGVLGKGDIDTYQVSGFKEKPDLNTAKDYIKSGKYLWNSGMFISKVSVMLDAIRNDMPELHKALINIKKSPESIKEEFEKLESVSIDYGIMEKNKELAVIEADMHWDDIGDWLAMERFHEKDKDGNTIQAENVAIDTKNSIIFGDKLVATLGIEDLVVVTTKDAVLVCKKDRAQELKSLVKKLPKEYL